MAHDGRIGTDIPLATASGSQCLSIEGSLDDASAAARGRHHAHADVETAAPARYRAAVGPNVGFRLERRLGAKRAQVPALVALSTHRVDVTVLRMGYSIARSCILRRRMPVVADSNLPPQNFVRCFILLPLDRCLSR